VSSSQGHQPVNKSKTSPNFFQQMWANLDVQSTAALMVLATAVGLGTGLTAVIFIKAINWITAFSFTGGLSNFLSPLGNAWIIFVPIIGSLISGPIIALWAIEAKGHGVPEVMQAIIMKGGSIRPRVAVVKSVASAVCIGTGGSAGREGPIVQVGAALGSTAAQILKLGKERTITLVACGAAAGIAATFNAPVAGVIFAMEVILGRILPRITLAWWLLPLLWPVLSAALFWVMFPPLPFHLIAWLAPGNCPCMPCWGCWPPLWAGRL